MTEKLISAGLWNVAVVTDATARCDLAVPEAARAVSCHESLLQLPGGARYMVP
eukprot:COSAG06_NODE_1693_length_8701_cov_80.626133_14_plen_53_part_00